MSLTLDTPRRIDEPQEAAAFSQVITDVAANQQSIIVQRNGTDVAVVIPVTLLDILHAAIARQERERLAASIDWDRMAHEKRPPQAWFDSDDDPFTPEPDSRS